MALSIVQSGGRELGEIMFQCVFFCIGVELGGRFCPSGCLFESAYLNN
jgi:hypothetical protein